ncbi:MAG TPA: tail fiber protein [Stellaceae bacterium]|nr:tail fiber protein [Stellaceae bacterium]
MADTYISMIEAFGFSFAPRGWAICAGQTLPINQYQALFALLGTTFGGDGQRTFNLPDLRGRLALAFGQGTGLSNYSLGAAGGQETHTLTTNEVPGHNHSLNARNNGQANGTNIPGGAVSMGSGYAIEANNPVENIYSSDAPTIAMGSASVGSAGGNQPHENRMPFLTINYCIALQGIFPSRN